MRIKKATTAAVAHCPTASAAITPSVINVCEVTWRLRVARMTLRKIDAPLARTIASPTTKGTRSVNCSNNPNHSPMTTTSKTAPKTMARSVVMRREKSLGLLAESLGRGKILEAERQNEYFRFIVQECRRLSALIENVLDF